MDIERIRRYADRHLPLPHQEVKELCDALVACQAETAEWRAVSKRNRRNADAAVQDIQGALEAAHDLLDTIRQERLDALAERDALQAENTHLRQDFYERDLPQMQRRAMWLDPDPDLPLPNLERLVTGAIEREAKALDDRDRLASQVTDLKAVLLSVLPNQFNSASAVGVAYRLLDCLSPTEEPPT